MPLTHATPSGPFLSGSIQPDCWMTVTQVADESSLYRSDGLVRCYGGAEQRGEVGGRLPPLEETSKASSAATTGF